VPSDDSGGWRFPPQVLREYALVADGERGALIGPRGDVVWLCAPAWHSDAVFSSLIGGVGAYAVTPAGRFVWGGYYEDSSLIWRSRWITETGIVECREALAFPGETGRVVLLRRIVAVDGESRVRVLLDARAGFGRHRMTALSREGGLWTGKSGPLRLRWTGAERAAPGACGQPNEALAAELDLRPGEEHDLVLELSAQALPDSPPDAEQAWTTTAHAWRQALPSLTETVAERDARHSYAVLRGLTSSGGGMVAAATMSLPERAEQGRDYDYRYVWIRDQAFAGQAAAAAGANELLDDAVRFVAGQLLTDGPAMSPAYTITGGAVHEQRSLGLPGYPGGFDIVGNHVRAKFQIDGFGEALSLLAAAARADRLDADGWRAAEAAAGAIEQRWGEPEAGIWELDDQRWTESRLACVAGLRAIAAAGAPPGRVADWSALADAILAETATCSLHPDGHWQRAPGDDRVDAALLLPPIRGAPPGDDPRSLATVRAVRADLAEEHYLYRFRHGSGPLGAAEGAFLLCGFTMALAQHQQGEHADALRWYERNRAACGPPGLFSEEYDVTQRQLRGNLPQAFVHALALQTAVALARPGPSGR
jgi:GH15 family glucan-1,4-alpha-glucosidase